MKVGETGSSPSSVMGLTGKDERKVPEIKEASFKSQLQKVENGNLEQRINSLVAQIMEQGEKLGKKVDVKELKVYKKLIAEFLDEALGNSQRFSKQSFLDRRGRHKMYAVVKRINVELDELTQEVLHTEKDHIHILQRLEDIRGLILDIVM